MTKQPYDSEDLLQDLLARYPNLLAGDQMDEEKPRRWLLISREVSLATEEDGGGRWSVDHLFLDQDAVPTIVEVKRSTDTRIRREVVGQMLDYAANAVTYWPVEYLRAQFEAGCENQGVDAESAMRKSLSLGTDQEDFWERTKTNLQAGRVRLLVFVADEIPAELRRIVEFLNEQMDPAEVLAVEIKQFAGQGMKALVPCLVGQTAEARRKKARPALGGRQWDEPSFFRSLEERRAPSAAARRILEWARKKGLGVAWGRGRQDGSFTPEFDHGGTLYKFVRSYTYGSVEILFEYLLHQPPFEDESVRVELLDRLNSVPGASISEERSPSAPSSTCACSKTAPR